MVASAGLAAAVAVVTAAPAAAEAADTAAIAGTVPAWATPTAKTGDAPAGQVRHIQVALAPRDPDGARATAVAVSTPGSLQYRQFLSTSEFMDRYAPTPQTVEQVSAWLRGKGLTVARVAANRHFIEAAATVEVLQAAFGVKLATFRLPTKGGVLSLVAPQTAVSVPRALRGVVQAVLGLDDSARLIMPNHTNAPGLTGQAAPAGQNGAVAPAADPTSCARFWGEVNNPAVPQKYGNGNQSNRLCGYTAPQLRAVYGLGADATGAGTTVAITGAYHLDTIVADTNRAAADFGAPPLVSGQYQAFLARPFDRQQECGEEAWHAEQAADVQAVHEIAPAARIVFYGARNCFGVLSALNEAVAQNTASVITNSWGYPGESLAPAAERQQLDDIALQAAIQGQSVLFSSGDAGDNAAVTGRAEPSWPPSHPWVTGVGGTTVALDAANRIRFTAGWESSGNTQQGTQWVPQRDADGPFAGGAGGGGSAVYAQPDYQRGIVPDAIARGGRATPDVAALADSYTGLAIGYTSAQNGFVEIVFGGTSLASPILAGLVVNAEQAQRRGRLGFLNTALYAMAGTAGVTDVTPVAAGVWTPVMDTFAAVAVPTDPGSYLVDIDARPQTLHTTPGWDPVTGVGTPNAAFLTTLGR